MSRTVRSWACWPGRKRRDGEAGDNWHRHGPTWLQKLANRRFRLECRAHLREDVEDEPQVKGDQRPIGWYWW